MSESTIPTIGDIEAELREDIASERFDRYLFTTFRVDEPYLEQFRPDNDVLLCGPEEVGDIVEGINQSNITWQNEKAHAKCYLMWNEKTAKVWYGSFNLTESGLRESIEWGMAHEAQLDIAPTLSEMQAGTCQPESVTSDVLLQQTLNVLFATLADDVPTLAADVRSKSQAEDMAVLTNSALPGPSGFHEAIEQILEKAHEEVELTYFTPYVTACGVNELAGAVPSAVDDADLDIEIRTCRIEEVDDPESYLDQEDLDTLRARYGSVDLLARTAGRPGEELENGRLRSGMAHFKLLVIAYQESDGTEHSEIILTSANLSYNAWGRQTDQLEFGLWVRDQSLTQQLTDFFCNRLLECYSRPNQLDFETIESLDRPDPIVTKRSLLDQISSRFAVTSSEVCLDWTESDPPLQEIQAEMILHELTSDESDSETIEMSQSSSAGVYRGQFDESLFDTGWILHRVQLTITTPVYPTEYELTEAGHEKLVEPDSLEDTIEALGAFLERRQISWDSLVLNGHLVIDGSSLSAESVDTIESIRIRRHFEDGPRELRVSVRPDEQPHFTSSPIADVTTETEHIPPFGGFGRVSVTAGDSVHLEHDMLEFVDETGTPVDYLGYAEHNNGYDYIFADMIAGSSLYVSLGKPYDAYFSDTRHRMTMPEEIPETDPRIRRLCEADAYQFSHQPAVTGDIGGDRSEECITSERAVEISPASKLLAAVDTQDRLAYEWQRRVGGYRAPTHSWLDQSIPPNPAHSRVEYHGLIAIGEEENKFSLQTPANQFRVRQQVFASDVSPDSKVVRGRNLEKVAPDDHVGWLIFTSDSLLRSSVTLSSGRSIELAVTIDGDGYDRSQSYGVFTDGQMFLIPIFGRHIEGTIRVTLQLRVADGPASYGANEIVRKIQHERTTEGVRRIVFDADGNRQSQIPIPHDPTQDVPRLDMYQDQIQSNDLENYLKRTDSFQVHKRTPTKLVIEAKDTTVLCLGPYSP